VKCEGGMGGEGKVMRAFDGSDDPFILVAVRATIYALRLDTFLLNGDMSKPMPSHARILSSDTK